MPISFHTLSIAPVIRALKNLAAFLSKGEQHAKTHSLDPNSLLTASLHPTMADLIHQIYWATDNAKGFIPTVNPSAPALTLPDVERTFPELLARIHKTVSYLESLDPKVLEGREADEVYKAIPPVKLEMRVSALDYVQHQVHGNIWFHVTTAYDILRKEGVEVGKLDFLNAAGEVPMKPMQE